MHRIASGKCLGVLLPAALVCSVLRAVLPALVLQHILHCRIVKTVKLYHETRLLLLEQHTGHPLQLINKF